MIRKAQYESAVYSLPARGVFYCEDRTTRKQVSLWTKDEQEALTLLHAKNESLRQPTMNLQIAQGISEFQITICDRF